MLTVIISAKNKNRNLYSCHTSLVNSLGKKDQIIICHKTKEESLTKDFPKNLPNHVIYENNQSEGIMINDCIIKYAINDNILIVDQNFEFDKKLIENIKKSIKSKTILIPSFNKNLESLFFCFKKSETLPFNTFFNDNEISQKDIKNFVERCKGYGINIDSFNHNPNKIRKRKEQAKTEKKKKMSINRATVIYSKGSVINCDTRDEMIPINRNSFKDFHNAIMSAKNECIILVNPKGNFNKTDFISSFKFYYDHSYILTSTDDRNVSGLVSLEFKELKDYYSICFSKSAYKLTQWPGNEFNVGLLIREIASKSFLSLIGAGDIISDTKPSSKTVQIINQAMKKDKVKKKQKRIQQRIKKEVATIPDLKKFPKFTINRKPKIVFVVDVEGWAWDIKTKMLKKFLDPYYDIDISYAISGPKRINELNGYDLCFTYGYSYVKKVGSVPIHKRLTGITAHRPMSTITNAMLQAGVVHANSVLLYRELKKIHKNVFYVPNGINEKMFYMKKQIPLQRKNIVVGHVGKQSTRKGQVEYLLPAVKKSNADKLFHMNNHKTKIPHKDIVNLYQDMDIFVVASKEDGTPNPALEAMACGRPVISNYIGNMPEAIKDGWNGFLVKKEIDEYVDKINWCRDNREKVIEMGLNARKEIEENWTWQKKSKNYLYMFDTILSIKRDEKEYEGRDKIEELL